MNIDLNDLDLKSQFDPEERRKREQRVKNWMLIGGILLSCTVWGAIIGIPMIIVAFQDWDK